MFYFLQRNLTEEKTLHIYLQVNITQLTLKFFLSGVKRVFLRWFIWSEMR